MEQGEDNDDAVPDLIPMETSDEATDDEDHLWNNATWHNTHREAEPREARVTGGLLPQARAQVRVQETARNANARARKRGHVISFLPCDEPNTMPTGCVEGTTERLP